MSSSERNRHHLCYPKKYWSKGFAKQLRDHWYMSMLISKNMHDKIHAVVPIIPVPRGLMAKDALEQLDLLEEYKVLSRDDPLKKRLLILVALFECVEQPTADAFTAQLAIACEK